MLNILLVVPNYSDQELENYSRKILTVPYGVLSMASYVEYYCPNVKCEILDLNEFQDRETQHNILKQKMTELNPDFVGLSVMFNSCFEQVDELCTIIKEVDSDVTLFAGGVLATNLPEDLFETTNMLDALCYGEGEIPLKDLLLSDDIQETLRLHPAWLTKKDFENGKKSSAVFVQDLDEIPPLEYSKLNIKKYVGRTSNDGDFARSALPIQSTRGCPYSCVFCCAGTNHGKKIRCMSAERFLSDVKLVVDKYNVQKISVDDDQFLFYRERAVKILNGLAEFNLEVELASGINIKFVDDEIATLMKKAGVKIAFIAVESGSQRVLKDIINKPLDVVQIKPAVESLRKAGLLIHSPFLIGLPGETQEDRDLSRELILDVGFDWASVFIATPFKGSKLYDICVENNYMDPSRISKMNTYNCVIKAPGVDPDEINRQFYSLNLDVNFLNNYNYLNGNYELALSYFSRIAIKYPDHAFAHYYSSLCYKKLGNNEKADFHMKEFDTIINTNEDWKQHAINFKLIAA